EVERSLRVLDGTVAVFCAVGGVQPQSETVWRQAHRYEVPRMAYVNKMDRTGADFFAVIDQMKDRLATRAVAIQLPIGSEDRFTGLVDLITMTAWNFNEDAKGVIYPEETEIPDGYQERAQQYHEQLVELAAEFDDELMMKVLEGESYTQAEVKAAIRKGTLACEITPVVCGASFKNKGIQQLLDGILDYMPSPLDIPAIKGIDVKSGEEVERKADAKEPFAALAFK
ncbi:MAG TPA: elongation factor G, partial [Coriobacteriia bacterium]|nr:elongation factor G [Coriobacteriia bacterium]